MNNSNSNSNHKNNIDILRICAAVAIILSHTSAEFTLREYNNSLISIITSNYAFLSSGVDLFFVISGYVIMLSLNSKYQKPNSFLKGRIRRIIPIYWMLTIFTLLSNICTNFFSISNIEIAGASKVFSSLFFVTKISNNSPPIIQQGWTLEYEMLFYLLVFLTLFIRKRKIGLCLIILILIGLSFTTFYLMLEFLGGIIVYIIQKNKFSKKTGLINLSLGLFLLVPGMIGIIKLEHRLYFVIPYSFILFGVLNIKQVKSKFVVLLGQVSYPMYLFQGITIPILYQYIKLRNSFLTVELLGIYALSVGITFICSYFILYLFDKPISQRLKAIGW
jgi:peptidoglycan/LPS O-acetylase OafA/YrhL